jgi:large-conductance mechanosensitive channel
MEEPSPSLSVSDSKKWILRIALALILGQAIWGLVVALTSHLLVPLIARVMGGDPNSPLYLGKGDVDVPALFVAIVEFCLAGIVAVIMNSWVQKPARIVVRKVAAAGSLSLQQAPSPAPMKQAPAPKPQASIPTAPIPAAAVPTVTAPVAPPVAAVPVAKPAPPPAPAKPDKPKAPKEVYYNIVGEPISMDDD